MIPAPAEEVRDVVRRALAEDLGLSGDITTNTVVPSDAIGTGRRKSSVARASVTAR